MKFMLYFLLPLCGMIVGCGKSQLLTQFPEEPIVRVLILEGADHFNAEPLLQYTLKMGDAEYQLIPGQEFHVEPSAEGIALSVNERVIAQGQTVELKSFEDEGLLKIRDVAFGQGWWWANAEDRTYKGTLTVNRSDEGKLNVIVALPVEEYLRGVVPSEIGTGAPLEAMKAQAVAARAETITALRKGVYAGPGYDICATVQCQVYGGTSKGNDQTDLAIEQTRGLVLSYNGETIPAYYSSNCGGCTENIENVWNTRFSGTPVWQGVPEGPEPLKLNLQDEVEFAQWIESNPNVYCNRDAYPMLPQWTGKNFRWSKKYPAKELSAFVAKINKSGSDIGLVTEIVPLKRGVSGRIDVIQFIGEKGEVEVGPELNIRRVWEPPLKSSAFTVLKEGEGEQTTFTISGAGYGHGVGLCQTGAMGRAFSGQTFREILQHYYTESQILKAYK